MLLHFMLVLHFAAIVITFCVSITFCGNYYILRRNSGKKAKSYGALLVPPACVYTLLFFWRDFFALDVTPLFIRVSGANFVYSARPFFITHMEINILQ